MNKKPSTENLKRTTQITHYDTALTTEQVKAFYEEEKNTGREAYIVRDLSIGRVFIEQETEKSYILKTFPGPNGHTVVEKIFLFRPYVPYVVSKNAAVFFTLKGAIETAIERANDQEQQLQELLERQ